MQSLVASFQPPGGCVPAHGCAEKVNILSVLLLQGFWRGRHNAFWCLHCPFSWVVEIFPPPLANARVS